MKIAVDAVGGDFYPKNPIEGALAALSEFDDLSILLLGPEEQVRKELGNHDYPSERIQVVHAPEIVGMKESPAVAIKTKQESSIVVGMGLHKAGQVDGFVSAGNTGALLAASTFILGKLEGVHRPTIATFYPTIKGFRLLVDAGANLELKPDHAVQFARMAQVYSKVILNIEEPTVGLLNVGEEEEKGTDNLKLIHAALKPVSGFIGNVEGRDVLSGKADIYVCDGVVGNILLKFGETIPATLMKMLQTAVAKTTIDPDDVIQTQKILKAALAPFDYQRVGGIPFLGVNGVSIVGHGGSSPLAIKNMIKSAIDCVKHDINGQIVSSLN
ncbi:MAG: phosphate acyltransferase PlsX [Bacteroidota bacterium]